MGRARKVVIEEAASVPGGVGEVDELSMISETTFTNKKTHDGKSLSSRIKVRPSSDLVVKMTP